MAVAERSSEMNELNRSSRTGYESIFSESNNLIPLFLDHYFPLARIIFVKHARYLIETDVICILRKFYEKEDIRRVVQKCIASKPLRIVQPDC